MTGEEFVTMLLDEEERSVLCSGIVEWGGPARPTEELAVAMGFDGTADLSSQSSRLLKAVQTEQALTRSDWRRVLLLTEIVFASNVFGSGLDWETTTGFADALTIRVLRQIQRKTSKATSQGPRPNSPTRDLEDV